MGSLWLSSPDLRYFPTKRYGLGLKTAWCICSVEHKIEYLYVISGGWVISTLLSGTYHSAAGCQYSLVSLCILPHAGVVLVFQPVHRKAVSRHERLPNWNPVRGVPTPRADERNGLLQYTLVMHPTAM